MQCCHAKLPLIHICLAECNSCVAALQVHVPLYDPSSVLQLVVCSAQPKVHKARVLTRAVRSMLTQVPMPHRATPQRPPFPPSQPSHAWAVGNLCQECVYMLACPSALGIMQHNPEECAISACKRASTLGQPVLLVSALKHAHISLCPSVNHTLCRLSTLNLVLCFVCMYVAAHMS